MTSRLCGDVKGKAYSESWNTEKYIAMLTFTTKKEKYIYINKESLQDSLREQEFVCGHSEKARDGKRHRKTYLTNNS